MRFLLSIVALTGVCLAQDGPCSLATFVRNDADRYEAEAAERGWIVDGQTDDEAIIADVGQTIYDGCVSVRDSVTADNVELSVCQFYGLDCGVENPGGGQCWQGDDELLADAQSVVFWDCLGLTGEKDPGAPGGEGGCPLTSKIKADSRRIVEDAVEQGWYVDGFIDLDAVAADIGQDATDACQALSQEITEENLADQMRAFYGLEPGGNPSGGPCWTEDPDLLRESKELVFFDCAFDELQAIGK